MKSLFLLLTSVLLLALISCDDRGADKPRMEFFMSTNTVYGNGAQCNLNYADVSFRLEGNPGFVNDVKILVEYDSDMGLFVGTGSSQFVITDNEGNATGRFVANENAVGVTTLKAKVERFPSVEETLIVYVYDVPEITHLIAETPEITPDGGTEILVIINDSANQVANKRINFTTNKGLLQYSHRMTDNDGRATNFFSANGETGTVVIKAALDLCPNENREVTITIE
jgi:hypothetical protein